MGGFGGPLLGQSARSGGEIWLATKLGAEARAEAAEVEVGAAGGTTADTDTGRPGAVRVVDRAEVAGTIAFGPAWPPLIASSLPAGLS